MLELLEKAGADLIYCTVNPQIIHGKVQPSLQELGLVLQCAVFSMLLQPICVVITHCFFISDFWNIRYVLGLQNSAGAVL